MTVPLTYSYYNLELRPNGSGGPNYTLGSGASQTLTVTNNLTFGDGTNAVTIKADTYNPATNVGGSATINAGATYTKGSGTFTFNGTTAGTFTDSTSTPQNLGVVAINKTDTAAPSTNDKVTLVSSMTVDTLTIDGTAGQADTLDLGTSGYTLKLANAGSTATVLTVSGTLTIGISTIQYSATNSGGNINVVTLPYSSVQFSGAETYVLAGNVSGANAISGSVTIDSGATLDVVAGSDYAVAVGGNWSSNGTFRPRSGTVTFNGTASQTITSAGNDFANLTLANTGTVGTTSDDLILADALIVNSALTVTSGELKLSTNNISVQVAGNVTIASAGIITKGTGTWTFNGTTAATYTDSTSAKQNLGTVSINKTSTSSPSANNKVTLASSMTADALTIDGTSGSADTLDLGTVGSTLKLANSGSTADVLTIDGTLTAGTSVVEYSATNSGGNVHVATAAYSSLTVSGTETYVVSGDVTVSGALTTGVNSTLSLNSGVTLTHEGTATTNNGTIGGSGTLRFPNSASAGPGTGGTINAVVRYDVSSGAIGSSIVTARTYRNRVEFYASSASNRTITLASGTYTLSGASSHFFVIADGSGNVTVDGGANPTVNVQGDLDFTGTGTGAETITTGTGTWTVSGNVNLAGGTVTATGSTLVMDGTSKTLTTAGNALAHLTVSGSVTASGDTTVANTLTVDGTFTAPSGTLSIGGSFDNDGTFNHSNGTVVFTGMSGTKTVDADGTGSEAFHHLTFSGSAQWNLDTAVTVNGTFTQSSGTIVAPLTTLAVAGNFVHSNGTFTANGGTVTLSGGDQTVSGATTFANVTKAGTAAATLTFPAGVQQTITGTLTLMGTADGVLALRSSSPGTQWLLDPQGTRMVQYLSVQDSKNVHTTKIRTAGLSVTDAGNNTGWAFPPTAPTALSGSPLSSTAVLWTWTDTSDRETGFKLQGSDGSTLVTAETANADQVEETGLVRGTTYVRQIVAYNEDGDSDPSATASATTNASPPSITKLRSPENRTLLNTLTPTFSFSRSTDADDGMGTYTLLLNPETNRAKTVFLSEVPATGTQTLPLANVTGTAETGTVTLTDNELLHEGDNTWKIRATDKADNTSNSAARTLTIDVTKPTLVSLALDPQSAGSTSDALTTTAQQPTLTLVAEDNYALGSVAVHFIRRRFLLGEEIGANEELKLTAGLADVRRTVRMTPKTLLPYGVYRIIVDVADAAGNASSAERTLTIQTQEKATQQPGTTPSEEREKEIEQGTTPTKTPIDFTLPELEKHAKERKEKEAANLLVLLQRFVPEGPIERFNLTVGDTMRQLRHQLATVVQAAGSRLAAVFGFTKSELAKLRALVQRPACGMQCAANEQALAASPAGALDRVLPRLAGRVILGLHTVQEQTLQLFTAARKQRTQLATKNEQRLARLLEPVTHAVRWIGVGARVALEGIRGRYNEQLRITDVAIGEATSTSAVISWKTNRVSRGKVNYGPSISYGEEALESSFTANHSMLLENLQPNTKYYFEVLATDLSGATTFDAYYGFATLAQ